MTVSQSPYSAVPPPRAVEEVGSDRVVTGGGEATRHVLDVGVDTERFLHHDHAPRAVPPSGTAS